MGYTIGSKIVSEIFEDEAVVVNLEIGSYYSFRGAAFGVWKMVEAGHNAQQIITSSENQEAVRNFLDYLFEEGIASGDDLISCSAAPSEKIQGNVDYTKYDDMKDLLLIDPIHEVDQKGWPNKSAE